MPPERLGVLAPDFIHFFDTLALTADYGPFNRRPARLRKWTGAVTIIPGEGTEGLLHKLDRLALQLSEHTGLPFELAGPGTSVAQLGENTILIRAVPSLTDMRLFEESDIVCQTETHGTGGVIQTAVILISKDYADCLEHEFMHALGFDAHWQPADGTPIRSVLALRGSPLRTDTFSPWDIVAIRLLYDRRMRAGMERHETLHAVREILDGRPQSAALAGNEPTFRIRSSPVQ